MACGSCSSGGCSPSGCGDKGHCASGGCNRLNVYDWLADVDIPTGFPVFDVVEIRFKAGRKDYYANVNGLDLFPGDLVAVEAQSGHDIGEVSLKGELVRLQLKKKRIKDVDNLRKIYRVATEADLVKYTEAKQREPEVVYKTREIIQRYKLEMKLSDVETQGDNSKITFFYTADDRVDFRELIKTLAETFKVRVEMRQIGARQEAALIGGIGACGRELCCTTWLTDFKSVNTGAARYQNLSLNPLKLAGQCGRLKCCLNYELDTYMDALKHFPDDARFLYAETGTAELQKTDIFKQLMWYNMQGQDANAFFALSVDKVVEIKKMNKQGAKPLSFEEMAFVDDLDDNDEVDIQSSLNVDSLTRFDQGKQKRKKKKGGNQNAIAEKAANSTRNSTTETSIPTTKNSPNIESKGQSPQRFPNNQTLENPNQAAQPNPNNRMGRPKPTDNRNQRTQPPRNNPNSVGGNANADAKPNNFRQAKEQNVSPQISDAKPEQKIESKTDQNTPNNPNRNKNRFKNRRSNKPKPDGNKTDN